jgi:hypothetical protein
MLAVRVRESLTDLEGFLAGQEKDEFFSTVGRGHDS